MVEHKITCSQCGLDYFPQLIKFHKHNAFCEICEMDYLVEIYQTEQEIHLPNYFLSERHLNAFLSNLKGFQNIMLRSSRDVLSAYIHAIPALHRHPYIDMEVFNLFPFIWQFELIILEHSNIPGTDIRIKRDSIGRFEQTKFVKTLDKDLQIILYAAHLLTSNEVIIVDTGTLTVGFSKLLEEMVRFYEVY